MSEIGNDKSLTKFGLYGAIIGIITGIYWAFISSQMYQIVQDIDILNIIIKIVNAIGLVGFVLITIGYVGLTKGRKNESYQKILFLLLGAVLIFNLIDTILGLSTGKGINWGEAGFLQTIVVWTPALFLFIMYWNYSIYAKILVVLRIIRIIIYLSLRNTHYRIYVGLAEKIILIIWFSKGITPTVKKKISQVLEVPSPSPVSTVKGETEIRQGIYHETEPGAHGIPRLLHWCDNCNGQKKIRINQKDFIKAHNCPTCGQIVKTWWAPRTKKGYYKFIIFGAMFFAGLVLCFMATYEEIGLPAIILSAMFGIPLLIIGSIGLWKTNFPPVNAPPEHAAAIPPAEPMESFGAEAIRAIFFMLLEGAVIFGGLWAVVSTFI